MARCETCEGTGKTIDVWEKGYLIGRVPFDPSRHSTGSPCPDCTQMKALKVAEALGIPAELFWSICEYLDDHPLNGASLHYRYAANTRARALAVCRAMVDIKLDTIVHGS